MSPTHRTFVKKKLGAILHLPTGRIPITSQGPPRKDPQMEDADDVDFIDEEKEPLDGNFMFIMLHDCVSLVLYN